MSKVLVFYRGKMTVHDEADVTPDQLPHKAFLFRQEDSKWYFIATKYESSLWGPSLVKKLRFESYQDRNLSLVPAKYKAMALIAS